MSKDLFLNPSEIEKRKKGKQQIINTNLEDELDESEKKEMIIEEEKPKEKFYKRSGKATVEFESMGRFDLPDKLYFNGYSTEHITDLTLAGEDTLLETVVAILDEIKNEDFKGSIGDATLEEFMEIMITIKASFNTISHVHKWVCNECEKKKEDKESEPTFHDYIFNLKELKYKSIEEADQILRDIYKPKFLQMNNEIFEEYLKRKYRTEYTNLLDYDRETEVNKIRIEEPLSQNVNGDIYKYRFMRIKDLIKAKKIVEKKYAGRIKMIQNKQVHGVNADTLKLQKKEELDIVNKEKVKEILLTTRALSLLSVNDKELSDDEKVLLYRKIPSDALFEFIDFLDRIKIGIQDEREFICPICGHVDKRLLQRRFDPLEFLPIESTSSNKFQESTGVNIFVGI